MAKTCPHYERLPFASLGGGKSLDDDQLMQRLKRKLENDKGCNICGKNVRSSYICLSPDCLFMGCGRNEKRHAMDHYRSKHKGTSTAAGDTHCFFLDVNAYQCWCYECDDMICPPLFSDLERNDDAQTVSSVTTGNSSIRRKTLRTVSLQFPAGAVGLYNLGNSCYMNAALQCLLNW